MGVHNTDNESIFNEWYERNEGRIRELCLDYVPDKDYEGDADDLAQEVYTRIWENIEQFEGKSTFDTWANRVAINTLNNYLDYCNADKRTGDIEQYDDECIGGYTELDPAIYEKYNLVQGYTEHLKGRDKSVMQMYEDGYSHKEIAKFLELTEDQVDWSIRRAKKAIREMAAHDEDWDFGEVVV